MIFPRSDHKILRAQSDRENTRETRGSSTYHGCHYRIPDAATEVVTEIAVATCSRLGAVLVAVLVLYPARLWPSSIRGRKKVATPTKYMKALAFMGRYCSQLFLLIWCQVILFAFMCVCCLVAFMCFFGCQSDDFICLWIHDRQNAGNPSRC